MTEQQEEQQFNPETHDAVLVYTDEDGKVHEYDGDPSSLTFKQIWDMQKVTGLNGLSPIGDALSEMNAPALMALLWVNLREEQPDAKFSDLNSVRLNQIEMRGVPKAPVGDPKAPNPDSTSGADATSSPSYPSSDTTSESDPATSPA